jgi:hypothetical protein
MPGSATSSTSIAVLASFGLLSRSRTLPAYRALPETIRNRDR